MIDVRERDGHRCILCEKGAGEVHHVISRGRKKAYPEVNDEHNLVTLCPDCHRKVANQAGRFECLEYLIGLYGRGWYEEEKHEPWAQVLRRGNAGG